MKKQITFKFQNKLLIVTLLIILAFFVLYYFLSEIIPRYRLYNNEINQLLAFEKIDSNYCNSLNEGDKNGCIRGVALLRRDLTLCDKVDIPNEKILCTKTINALANNDPNLCDNDITCYRELAFLLNNPSICDKIDSDSTTYMFCYYYLAFIQNNSILCDKITQNSTRDVCYAMVSLQGDKCGGPVCRLPIALSTKNTQICENEEESFYNNICKLSISNSISARSFIFSQILYS